MRIDKLKKGTKLMWDASPKTYDGTDREIIFPCIVSDKYPRKRTPWVKIKMGNSNFQWMGPKGKYLREPSKEELETLKWPEI